VTIFLHDTRARTADDSRSSIHLIPRAAYLNSMELLTPVAALIALALLALRYGRDSRDGLPGQGLVGWAADRPRPAREVAMLEVVYPELVLDRVTGLRRGAASYRLAALRPRRPRRRLDLPRRAALWGGGALVWCGQALLALAAPPASIGDR
jgi:hypothetical protein